jgi:hypothetical protein
MRHLALVLVALCCSGIAAHSEIITPKDTMAPVVTVTVSCSVADLRITELRNIPDPPTMPPGKNDQVESGVAGVQFNPAKPNTNARLILVTSQGFPSSPSYKVFEARVEALDARRPAEAWVLVRDFMNNQTETHVVIAASNISIAPTAATFGEVVVGRSASQLITVRNDGGEDATLTDITVTGSRDYTITSGNTVPVLLTPGATHDVQVRFAPSSETSDLATDRVRGTLVITTGCGEISSTLDGVGVVPRLEVQDWDAGRIDVGVRTCAPQGLLVINTGTAAVTITSLDNVSGGFEFTSATAFPLTVNPGGSASLREICFLSAKEETVTIDVTVRSDATEGDTISRWTATTVTTTSVDEDADGLAGTYTVTLFDLLGNTIDEWTCEATSALSAVHRPQSTVHRLVLARIITPSGQVLTRAMLRNE